MMKKSFLFFFTLWYTVTLSASSKSRDMSPEVNQIVEIICRVNDHWQKNHPTHGRAFWDNAVYHTGNMEAYFLTKKREYLDYSEKWAEHNEWKGAKSNQPFEWKYRYGESDEYVLFGDYQICFQTYVDLYTIEPQPHKIARAKEVMEYQMNTSRSDYWWWADGLYMVMPVMTKMYKMTGDSRYLEKLYEYFSYADSLMYDAEYGLYYRDGKFVYPKHQTVNGKKDFWARGAGWVIAGLAKVLNDLPATDPHRPIYVDRFLSMAKAAATHQQEEGYWTRSIIDPAYVPGPETSGTALFTYGLLWGMNNGLLERSVYEPVVKKAWNYLSTKALQPDGTVGYVQPIGAKAIPGQLLDVRTTSNFGVGAFLLAACEMHRFVEREITPIPWADYDTSPLTSPLAMQAYELYQQGLKYTVNDWYKEVKKFSLQQDNYLDFGGKNEHVIRPVSHQAFALAVATRLNIYDESITHVSIEEAHRYAIRLISSLAYRHKANIGEKEGWGKEWQSAWWTAQTLFAAWMLWDELSEQDRMNVYHMTVYEADRFLDYKVPYYKDLDGKVIYKGDSKSEENAWNSDLMVLASVMFPHHTHCARWHHKALELQISAYASPSDKQKKKTINGLRLDRFLQGSNMEEEGTIVNHGRVHVDYMVAVMQNVINVLPYSLIGKPALSCSVFNADRIYHALNKRSFGGQTMYVQDEKGQPTAQIYFPEGNDWGTGNQVNYWLMDVMAHCFQWDKKITPKAAEWMHVRGEEMKRKQARNMNGAYYVDAKENSFPSREEFFLAEVAFGYLFLWTHQHQMTRFIR